MNHIYDSFLKMMSSVLGKRKNYHQLFSIKVKRQKYYHKPMIKRKKAYYCIIHESNNICDIYDCSGINYIISYANRNYII